MSSLGLLEPQLSPASVVIQAYDPWFSAVCGKLMWGQLTGPALFGDMEPSSRYD